MNDEMLDAIREVASIIDTVRGIPCGTSEYSAGLRVEATACVNFLRANAHHIADMAKRLEAAERDAALFAAAEYRAEKAVGGHGVRFELRFDPLVVHNGSLREYLQHAIDATQEGEV